MFGKLGHRLGVLLAICFLATCSGCQGNLLNRIFPNVNVPTVAAGPLQNLVGHPMALFGTLIVGGLIAAIVATKFFRVNLSFIVPFLTKFITWVFTPSMTTEQKIEQSSDVVSEKLDKVIDLLSKKT